MNKKLVHTPEGVRDIYGEEYAKKLRIESLIMENIRSYGYEDIQTPTFEFFDVFSKEVGTTPSRNYTNFLIRKGIRWYCGLISRHPSPDVRRNIFRRRMCRYVSVIWEIFLRTIPICRGS